MDYSLNQNQQLAVENIEGPMLIIAGPGSGKTLTLIERIYNIIETKNIKPENLFISTFTEKAAQEIMTRLSNKLIENNIDLNIYDMYIGTFHSICLDILEEYREFTRLKKSYTLMDQFDQNYFLYQNIYDYKEFTDKFINKKYSNWRKANKLAYWLNKISEEMIDASDLIKSEDEEIKALGEAYILYRQQIEENNMLDFSTIQLETIDLLKRNKEIRVELSNKIKYIMVDEYQDTNTIQEKILFKLINEESENICVVGDDDQGLYRFRGATIRNILEFPNNFKNNECTQINLDINYRSHPNIINFYNNWMDQEFWEDNKGEYRYNKIVEEQDKEFPKNQTVIKVSGKNNEDDWSEEVYEFLINLKEKNIIDDWNQVAFLFKSVRNHRVTKLANDLEDMGINIYSPRSNMFFDREEIKLMIGAIISIFPQFPEVRKWNENAHLKEWEYFDDCFELFANEVRKEKNSDLKNWMQKKANKHINLKSNTDYSFSDLFYEILQFPLFSRYLDINGYEIEDLRPSRNLSIFSNLLTKFEYLHNISVLVPEYLDRNIRRLFNNFLRYLMDGGIDEYEDPSDYAPSGSISFMTVHQSKGLEFPVVFVDSLYSYPRKTYDELEVKLQKNYYKRDAFEPWDKIKHFDFWRLYYTAFSRAENLLVLTCQENSADRRGQRNVPSKYFEEYYANIPSWKSNMFKPKKLELEEVGKVDLKNEYSFTSHILLYENCPLQYLYFKELDFTPVRKGSFIFGTVVHQTIEDIHKAVLRGKEQLINKNQIEAWFNSNYNNLIKKERVYLRPSTQKIALEQILNYVEKNKNNWSQLKEAEVEVSLVKEDYILKGSVDLIQGEDDTVEIIDFKTEEKPDILDNKNEIMRYKNQLEVYAHLIEQKIDKKVSRMHLYYTSESEGNPFISFDKNSQEINKTIENFTNIVKKIENKKFDLDERPLKRCQECDMRHFCDNNFK
ncbi:DNA helicase-2/ATP-dependent DNA helicase PcrA [Halanaerobium saccharolyticum]|uniref:DNA 3'-5' helicase n=1 Tax=Halanaerobium saccharolyticum TaxID=43595 RepID=A0A2T5RFR8_9FIRM|nr:ATP-dependent DNA helicase [Halanaerobium saccharolyticum]PTV93157.1 DNA helicase-2/ATP-dependent DNA helicase PcrA [Halanaerobium saccharolyticum]